jgi:hypothetical protein
MSEREQVVLGRVLGYRELQQEASRPYEHRETAEELQA